MTSEQVAIDIAGIKTTLARLERELLGNGQPGRIAKVETRLTDVEKFEFQAKGVIATLGVMITTVGAFLGKHLFGR